MSEPLLDEYGLRDVPDVLVASPAENVAADQPKNPTEFEYANKLADNLPLIKTVGKDWHVYDDGAWGKFDRAGFRPVAQNVLPPKIRTDRRANALLDDLEGRFQVPPDSFIGFNKLASGGEILINVGNGVVAVSPGKIQLHKHDPAHNFTNRAAAAYSTEASAPLFNRVLTEALPDEEDRRLYQLCAGNILLPDSRFEVAQINYGEAGRCKSTPAEAIANALGWDLVARLSMAHICDPKSYHLPKLRYAGVNLGTELDAIEMSDSATFKALVSGEPVEARPIYGSPFTMQTSCKLWFLANGLPRFKHGTGAELRRMRFIRFDFLPPTNDISLKSRLSAERDGIFLWMIQGLCELLTLSAIPYGGRDSRAVHDRFRISNDPVGAFVTMLCQVDAGARVEKMKLQVAYEEFCRRYELPTACYDWFFRGLYERWPNLCESRPGSGTVRARVITGIALNP